MDEHHRPPQHLPSSYRVLLDRAVRHLEEIMQRLKVDRRQTDQLPENVTTDRRVTQGDRRLPGTLRRIEKAHRQVVMTARSRGDMQNVSDSQLTELLQKGMWD